ncbi:helix-turn-helix transcriptional regulator [Paenibacillus albidus]|uniref:helix-turn-helix transcriptional regulator n=1 Tax=Paenibacillus albidus TaxID=2041023 RepID=UPI001BEA56CB|nr:helix-turn-helix transcriptional regulator [Paenibacillus albidus]MBT2293356.1 helix-turn-helix transcriptional regulator [Paenibacillus albidus]
MLLRLLLLTLISYLQPLNLRADRAYLSKRQFLRVFSRNYHTTPMDFVIRKRLDYSCTLLRNPGLSISRVAMESGFRDQNYYARQFKSSFHCTPSEYREKQYPEKAGPSEWRAGLACGNSIQIM